MTKFFLINTFLFFTLTTLAQGNISEYLKSHNYSFDIDKGFDQITVDSLKTKLAPYKLIIQSEQNHTLNFYKKLPIVWIKYLNANFNLTHFFLEWGHATDVLANNYLKKGDSSFLFTKDKEFWKSLFAYNTNIEKNLKLHYLGVDFERNRTYIKALKFILPKNAPTENIKSSIELIKSLNDSIDDCDYILTINKKLTNSLKNNKEEFEKYFSESYTDFERIILNRGNCNDVYKDRNGNMAKTFLSFDEQYKSTMYFGELGMAHTSLNNKLTTASIINKSDRFKNKICIVNTYCYNCTAQNKEIENWYLRKIEKDILQNLLPFCTSDFTLFDFSENIEMTKPYSNYGQFLIIVKNQN